MSDPACLFITAVLTNRTGRLCIRPHLPPLPLIHLFSPFSLYSLYSLFFFSLSPLLKLLRVFRGSRYLKKLSSTLSTQFNPSLFRFVNALAFLITAWHFIACFYWGMVGFEYVRYECTRAVYIHVVYGGDLKGWEGGVCV